MAVRLHPWPGPKSFPTYGQAPAYKADFGDNFKCYTLCFKTWEDYANCLNLIHQNDILFLGHRQRAVRAVTRGLEVAPEDPALRAALESMGWRRRPVLPFLSRHNPLNVWLGKVRHRWQGRARPHGPPAPATLGLPPAGGAPEA